MVEEGLSNDMLMLNMESMIWTRLLNGGPCAWGHSLTRISSRKFLLIGGSRSDDSKKVLIFDADDSAWRKQKMALEGSIYGHRAVAAKTDAGISVYCLGGEAYRKTPNNITVFDIA